MEEDTGVPRDNDETATAVDGRTAHPESALMPVSSQAIAPFELTAGGGVTTQVLAPFMVPQRPGDPLGLGITPETRPPAPPDPDVYDREREDAEYARSLLNKKDRGNLDAELKEDGFMPIEKVRELILNNTIKGSIECGGLDPEMMALIDARIDYKIFIGGDNIYTREELYDHFPFHEFNVQPEAIFLQQEVGVFPPRAHAMHEELEYVARDVGDETVDFMMIEDLVGHVTRHNYTARRAPLKIAKTKIYIGKERWDDFAILQRFFRGAVRVAAAQIAYGGNRSGGMPAMLAMFSGATPRGPALITDSATAEVERQERETEMKRREAELQRREEEQRLHDYEQRRRDKEAQEKITADLCRVEAMLTAAASLRRAFTPTPTPATPLSSSSANECEDDSVPL